MSQNFQLDCQVQLPGATWTSKTENWVFPIKYDSYQIIQSIQSVQSLALSIRPFYCHIIRGHTVHDIRIDRHFFGLHFPWRIYFVFKKWSSSGLFYGRICWGYLLNPLNLELEFWYFVKSTSLVTDCWCPLSESIQTSSGKATTKLFCLGKIKDHNVEKPIYYSSEKNIFSSKWFRNKNPRKNWKQRIYDRWTSRQISLRRASVHLLIRPKKCKNFTV